MRIVQILHIRSLVLKSVNKSTSQGRPGKSGKPSDCGEERKCRGEELEAEEANEDGRHDGNPAASQPTIQT